MYGFAGHIMMQRTPERQYVECAQATLLGTAFKLFLARLLPAAAPVACRPLLLAVVSLLFGPVLSSPSQFNS